MYTYNFEHSSKSNSHLNAYKEVLSESNESKQLKEVSQEHLAESLLAAKTVIVKSDKFMVSGKARLNEDVIQVSGSGIAVFKIDEAKKSIFNPVTEVLSVLI